MSSQRAVAVVQRLSRLGMLSDVLAAAAEMYGFELVIDEAVATRMLAVSVPNEQD